MSTKKTLKLDAGLVAAGQHNQERVAAAKKGPVPEAHGLVQYNLRLEPDTRDRLRHAAQLYRITERELIARFAATLPAPPPMPPMPKWLKES